MSADDRTCPSCGARVPAEADQCDLCGTPVGNSSEEPDVPPEDAADSEETPAAEQEGPEESTEAPTVFCNQCGWENPPGARFCSRCGEELQELSDVSPSGTRPVRADLPSKEESGGTEEEEASSASTNASSGERETGDEQAAMGRQIALVVGGALLLVLGLFFVTQWSGQYEWGGEESSTPQSAQAGAGENRTAPARSSGGQQSSRSSGRGGPQTAPMDLQALLDETADSLSSSIAGQADSLRTQIDQATGTQKRRLQAELVNLFIGAGHPGRAALVQKELAETTGTVDARRRTADLLYRWMQKLQGQGQRQSVFQVAQHAAEAYSAVAEQRPDDLDARTRMGEAYLLTNEPMRGIKAINAVLDDDSTFVPARFQKGLALLQINRLEQATEQFRKVKQFAEAGSPFYRQAERALKVIKQQRTEGPTRGSAPTPGADS